MKSTGGEVHENKGWQTKKCNDFEHWKGFGYRETQRLEDMDLWFELVPSFTFY